MNRRSRLRFRKPAFLLLLGFALAAASPLRAQPYGACMVLTGASGYVEIPDSPALNPTSAFTFEAWVSVTDANSGACSSIAGKQWTTSWWVGLCGTTLRSYLQGTASFKDGGTLDSGWNHIAVTWDGTNRRHYINGEVVGTFPETGPLPTNTSAMRIGSDVNFAHTPSGAIDEVRLWNVARTTDQIRSTINVPISTATTGLVAVWHLDGGGGDALGGHNGTVVGSAAFLDGAVAPNCTATSTSHCFESRFAVSASFTTSAGPHGVGTVVPGASTNSGLFWFFSSDNWEVLVKAVNGCGLNSRRWIFSAATTNVAYRLTVTDVTSGRYQGLLQLPGHQRSRDHRHRRPGALSLERRLRLRRSAPAAPRAARPDAASPLADPAAALAPAETPLGRLAVRADGTDRRTDGVPGFRRGLGGP